MVKFVGDFLFGLAFGCGFIIAYGVLSFIGGLIARGVHSGAM
jgi:hypothetical protein